MKVAIITDQHFGARKNSKLFHDYFLKFYNEVFFPRLEAEGITTVVDMGDTFDSRKGIDFSALSWAKNNYYDRLRDMGVTVHTIVGNHTAYYKNTNEVNAVDLLLSNLLKFQLAYVRWGTLSSTDLERIADTSWKKVWRATYLRSSTKCFQDTSIHGATTDESTT